jgi:hypothetical protein
MEGEALLCVPTFFAKRVKKLDLLNFGLYVWVCCYLGSSVTKLADCLPWAVFCKISKVAQIFGLLLSMVNDMYSFLLILKK